MVTAGANQVTEISLLKFSVYAQNNIDHKATNEW